MCHATPVSVEGTPCRLAVGCERLRAADFSGCSRPACTGLSSLWLEGALLIYDLSSPPRLPHDGFRLRPWWWAGASRSRDARRFAFFGWITPYGITIKIERCFNCSIEDQESSFVRGRSTGTSWPSLLPATVGVSVLADPPEPGLGSFPHGCRQVCAPEVFATWVGRFVVCHLFHCGSRITGEKRTSDGQDTQTSSIQS